MQELQFYGIFSRPGDRFHLVTLDPSGDMPSEVGLTRPFVPRSIREHQPVFWYTATGVPCAVELPKDGKKWTADAFLASLATHLQSDSPAILPILGFHTPDGTTLPVWFAREEGRIIATAPRPGSHLFCLAIDRTANRAVLLDGSDRALWLQPLEETATLLDSLLSGNGLPDSVPEALPILNGCLIREIQLDLGTLRILTESGLILSLGEVMRPTLIGTTPNWHGDFTTLPQEIQIPEVLAVLAEDLISGGLSCWHHVNSGIRIPATALPSDVEPVYMGMEVGQRSAIILDDATGTVYRVPESGDAVAMGRYSSLLRYEGDSPGRDTLFLQGRAAGKLMDIPVLDGVDSVFLGQSDTENYYRITESAWDHYNGIIVSNSSTSREWILFDDFLSTENLKVRKTGDTELTIRDTRTGKFMIIQTAPGDSRPGPQAHLPVLIFNARNMVEMAHLTTSLSALEGNDPDLPPEVPSPISSPPSNPKRNPTPPTGLQTRIPKRRPFSPGKTSSRLPCSPISKA